MSAVGVTGSTASVQEAGPGSTPRAALQSLQVKPIPVMVAKELLEREHYLHSLPGGTKLTFGIFCNQRLMGALALGAGPPLAYRLVNGATLDDCVALTRLWLSDELPRNSESRVLGIVLRALRRNTSLKFLISYADPSVGHLGTIYWASNWLYTGLSEAMPLYDLGDGIARHSRSVGHSYGSHSLKYLARNGAKVKLVPQAAKHRYIYFLDRSWQCHLKVSILPYPRKEESNASS
ncbi:DNA methyltransferase [Chloroflexota bacterium]